MIQELRTKAEFRDAMKVRGPIVITDTTTANRFHATPWACEHVLEDHFITKVITNQGRNGGYFSVSNFDEAQERWPSLVRCE
ncbi:MAG: hypothetical protein WD556_07680 [Actinomycetota bacterium]